MKIDNLEILNGLIAGAEGGTVEFKETTGQLERGMETLCAFLNGTGGTVLFGVTDKGKIIGQEVSDKTKRDIAETIRRIDPFATIDISYTDIPGTNKSVIALSAEEQRYMRPFTYKGRAYQRIESVTSAMPQGIYNLLVMQRGGTYAWDSMQNPSLKISDLDETAILGAVRGGIRGGRLPEGSMQEDVRTILEKFDLLNDGKLNNASVVLFGRNFYHYPQCLLRLARFKGTTKDEFLDNSCDASKIDTVKERLTENFVKISDNVVDRYDAISDKANEKNEMLKEHFEERVRLIEEKRKNNDNKY